MSQLDYLDFWLNSIHAHAARSTAAPAPSTDITCELMQPPVFIVGVNKDRHLGGVECAKQVN